ncbi:hypothetical protein IU486_29540 [Streptomyces gardneri]|uniref:hypothetical protein n=1 Tax=Nocardia TaxID=1817 RepID=UPI00135A81A9|nr:MULTISPECIES: hypothetical protein [Nocardia]MBF6168854.1 hypothetical protein [Streptomyces gardneri]MBF6208690.1 hypothetical protein [Streptomyces gardneri]
MATPTASGLLSPEEFRSLLDAIRAHSRAATESIAAGHGALPAYPLPDHLEPARLDRLPQPVRDVFDDFGRAPMRDQLLDNEQRLAPAADRCASGRMSRADFADLIARQIADDKTRFHATTDDLTTRLRDLGDEYPDSRVTIVNAMESYLEFAPGLWNQVYDYLIELEQDCRQLWPGVPSYFDGFRNEVEEFFVGLTS